MLDKIENSENTAMALSCVALGLLVGMSSALLSLFLNLIEGLFLGFNETAQEPAAVNILSGHRLVSVLLGGIVAAIIWYILRTKLRPTVTIKKAMAGGKMPFTETLVHVMTQIFYVGTGGSVGRELAPREMGVAIAQKWQDFLTKIGFAKLSEDDRQLLIAAAAGAGFAGVYIAPITGMFFCVEILLKKISIRTVSFSLLMSLIATLVGSLVKGFKPYYLVGNLKFSLPILIFVIIAGPLLGLIGGLFRKSFQWAEKNQTKSRHILWQLPLAAFVTGLISMNFPQIMGNGRALAQLSMDSTNHPLLLLLLFGAAAKALVTVLTIRSGASGGTLTPAIAIGAALGAVLGFFFLPFVSGLSITACALFGACVILASAQQAPLMALFMIFEVSHLNYSALMPLAFGVALALISSRWLLKKFS